ncbi:MAG TPA: hypothetical protein DHV89_11385, partial [Ruminococcus sp.]|nr:hypothetical protein [Ruminococcus sp.]
EQPFCIINNTQPNWDIFNVRSSFRERFWCMRKKGKIPIKSLHTAFHDQIFAIRDKNVQIAKIVV